MRVSAGGRATAVVVARMVTRARTTHGDSPASGREASGAVVEEDGVATPCASRHAAHTRCLPSAHSARGVRWRLRSMGDVGTIMSLRMDLLRTS